MTAAASVEPLTSKRRWQAVTAGTLLLLPAFWAMLTGFVAGAHGVHRTPGAPDPYAALALGLAIIPFVFLTLALVSSHHRVPGAVLAAMALSLLVGGPVSALAGDAVTGIVAGVGVGAAVALRGGADVSRRNRIVAVGVASTYAYVLIRTVGAAALLPAPVFPITAIGFADELTLWWRARRDAAGAAGALAIPERS